MATEITKKDERREPYTPPSGASFTLAMFFGPIGVAMFGAALVAALSIGGQLIGVVTPGAADGALGLAAFLFFAFIGAIIFGAPSYVLVFGPLAHYAARRRRLSIASFAMIGILANLIAWPLTIGVLSVSSGTVREAIEVAWFVHGFGFIFAPIFAASFGWALRELHASEGKGRAKAAAA